MFLAYGRLGHSKDGYGFLFEGFRHAITRDPYIIFMLPTWLS